MGKDRKGYLGNLGDCHSVSFLERTRKGNVFRYLAGDVVPFLPRPLLFSIFERVSFHNNSNSGSTLVGGRVL